MQGFRTCGVEPTQIIETDLWGGQALQHRPGVLVQVAEHPVPDSVIGNPAELLLDRLDGCTRSRPTLERITQVDARQIQSNRIHRGEPAHRLREVRAGHDLLLAAMALYADQCVLNRLSALAAPPCQRQRERAQQHIVDTAVVLSR